MKAVQKFKDQVDWSAVASILVASVVIGGAAYGLKKAGYGKVASVVKGG